VSPLRRPSAGPVRNATQQTTPSVCEPDTGRSSHTGRRTSHGLVASTQSVRLSPLPTAPPDSEKDQGVSGRGTSNSPLLAETTMVSGPTRAADGSPGRASAPGGPPDAEDGGEILDAPATRPVQVSRLDAKRKALHQAGFSVKTAARIAAPQRASTSRVYDGRWAEFCNWCSREQINPILASIPQVSEFLMWLFEKVPPLSVSTIKGYRSTLSSTLPNGIKITQSRR